MLVSDEWAVESEVSWSWSASSVADGPGPPEGVGEAVSDRAEVYEAEWWGLGRSDAVRE